MKQPLTRIAVALSMASTLLYSGFTKAADAPPNAPMPVQTVAAEVDAYYPQVSIMGQVKSSSQVILKSQVTGYLSDKIAGDGQFVSPGDLIMRIRDDDYALALNKAKAQLSIAQASLDLTRTEQSRLSNLYSRKAVSRQELDSINAQLSIKQAEAKSAQSDVDQRAIDLERTRITAPYAGVVGVSHVNVGDLIQAQSTSLVLLTALDPLWIEVGLSQSQMLTLYPDGTAPLSMLVSINGVEHEVPVSMESSVIDPLFGTVTLRADLPNADYSVKPGMFAHVIVKADNPIDAFSVPQKAMVLKPDGSYVYVIQEGQAKLKPVVTGPWSDENWWVLEGLDDQDKVITSGHIKLRPGVPVSEIDDLDEVSHDAKEPSL